jgi:DNA repair protein RecN (Recombination protein N)
LLRELRRKYGDDLAAVMAYGAEAARRRDELASHDTLVAELEATRQEQRKAMAAAEQAVAAARRKAAPRLARAVETQLQELAMPRAKVAVEVEGDGPGDEVAILLAANPGEPALPLAKAASGGELARTMLAAQLVLSAGPPTLIFDEVDAGIGGEAAIAVGRALAELAGRHQVIVVTHLAQVAAFADHQVAVTKREHGRRTIADATALDDAGRVRELARMLSGQPDSATAARHAEELLEQARAERRTRAAS